MCVSCTLSENVMRVERLWAEMAMVRGVLFCSVLHFTVLCCAELRCVVRFDFMLLLFQNFSISRCFIILN